MDYVGLAKLAAAVAVPIAVVAGLFFQMMTHSLRPFREDIAELRKDVHRIDVALARVEEAMRQPA